jgi:hypothetical protein
LTAVDMDVPYFKLAVFPSPICPDKPQ